MDWEYEANEQQLNPLGGAHLKISSFLKTLLLNRGFNNWEEIQKFLYPNFSNFQDPFSFEHMEDIIKKILDVKEKGEKIFIYGDYDVDGISSAVFLTLAFREIGIDTDYYIPNRSEEDYGLDRKNIDYMISNGVKLIITVDTSISNIEDIRYGRSLGVDVIITDHHKSLKDKEDNEVLFINPKLSDNYPFKSLSGAGVALKLAQALYSSLSLNPNRLYKYLDIVMIGTVADVVPVIGENRTIIKEGLKQLRNTHIRGLSTLLRYLKLNNKELSITNVSYFIVPLINSLGRIGVSRLGADFFIKKDDIEIYSIIEEMKKNNKKRRELETTIFNEASASIDANPSAFKNCIFLTSKEWHPGVIGIVASRLCLKYQVPTVLVSISNGIGKASSRSINGINIFDIFKKISHLFVRFGGHDLASGFIAKESSLAEIEESIKKEIVFFNYQPIKKSLKVDMTFSIDSIDEYILNDLTLLSPYGHGNPQPLFVDTNLVLEDIKKFGINNKHFSGFIVKGNCRLHVIGFDLGDRIDLKKYPLQKFDIVYYPEKNFYKEQIFTQIKLKDLKICKDFFNEFTS